VLVDSICLYSVNPPRPTTLSLRDYTIQADTLTIHQHSLRHS